MKKALIIYGSTTGNTESMSEIVGAGLKAADMEVEIKEVTNAKISDLTAYDLVLMGCPAYGDDEIMAIFPSVFAFDFEPAVGPSLVFMTIPAVFTSMPGGTVFMTISTSSSYTDN